MGNNLTDKDRLSSFQLFGWPHFSPGVEQLVASGFYRLRDHPSHDAVRCFYCEVTISNWNGNDNADEEHAKKSPECLFLLIRKGAKWIRYISGNTHSFVVSQNYEIAGPLRNREQGNLRPILDNTRIDFREQFATAETRILHLGEEYKIYPALNPRLRDMRVDSVRCCSSLQSLYSAEDFADAGFRWTGKGEQMKCTYCFLQVKTWSLNDDPFKIHAMLNPNCGQIILMRGKESIEKMAKGECLSIQEQGQWLETYPNVCKCGRDVPVHSRTISVRTGECCCAVVVYRRTQCNDNNNGTSNQ